MKRNKTNEEFAKELQEKRPDLEQLSFYVNAKTKIKVRCKECSYEWLAFPYNLFRQKACPTCSHKHGNEIQRTLLEDMLKEVYAVHGDAIEYISGYINKKTNCKWLCKYCGKIWKATPCNVINYKTGCPNCSRKKGIEKLITPLEKMLELVKETHGDSICYISGYKNLTTKCKWLCKICNTTWETTPWHIIHTKIGCPTCVRKKQWLPLEIMLQKLKETWEGLIEYVDGYKNLSVKCKFKCTECGYIWEAVPNNIIRGHGCPICITSSMEKPVMEALRKKGIIPIHNKGLEGCYFNNSRFPLRPDFIIKTDYGKLCIETDGKQHFKPMYGEDMLKLQQEKDRYKDKILKEQGFIVIRVTSSSTRKWGTNRHLILQELLDLIEIGIVINFEMFSRYDFNID